MKLLHKAAKVRFPAASGFFQQADLLRGCPEVREIKSLGNAGYAVTVEVEL